MTHKERMLAGIPYKASLDGLLEERTACKIKLHEYNILTCPDDFEKKNALICAILGIAGKDVWVESPFHCDYGYNIEVGDNFYANFNCVILDVGKVIIGDNVKLAPNVAIYTAGHPIHPDSRNSGYEYGIGITIGNNVWIGGNAVINPGITIGDNTVIGAGSVVTKDIPSNVIAAGVPCKVIRGITEADRAYYFKDRVFDVEDY